jgi:hypothetical protein
MDLDRDLHAANDFYTNRRYPEAIAMFERVIARRPDLVDAYRYMAYVYWQVGEPAAAIKTLEATITLGISDADIRTRLGTFYAQTGQPAKGIGLLSAAPADDVEAQNALGIAYAQAGKNGDAMKAFERVLAADSTNGIALQNIGTINLKNTIIDTNESCGSAITDQGNNISTTEDCGLNVSNGSIPGGNPMLGATAEALGGGTLVYRLLAGSPAIDTGDNPTCPLTDQRGGGFTRPLDGDSDGTATCDMGAFPEKLKVTNRRYVIDETLGAVAIFHNFPWIDAGLPKDPGTPASQTFRVEGGKNRYIHEVTVCTTPGCSRGRPPGPGGPAPGAGGPPAGGPPPGAPAAPGGAK